MEQKVEQLLHKGLNILIELREPFIQEWQAMLATKKFKNSLLVNEYFSMIEFAFKIISKKDVLSIDSFILSLLAEWQNRFPSNYDEYEAITLVTSIENIFHKLLAKKPSSSFLDHQAIQTFFSRILDHALLAQNSEDRIEKWSKMMIATNIFPMKWLAVVKNNHDNFKIEHIICSQNEDVNRNLIEMCTNLQANHIDHLSLALTRLLGVNKETSPILEIPCLNDTLLICLQDGTNSVSNQHSEFIRRMYLRQRKLQQLENKMDWTYTSILYLQRLLHARNAEQAVQVITSGLVDYMPFQRCALFLYNHHEDRGIGVSGYNVSNSAIQKIREEIFQLPLIKKYYHSLSLSQPLYFSDATEVLPEKYVRDFRLSSLVVVPIFVPTESKLIGIALLDQGEYSKFEVSQQTLTTLIKLGHYTGELLFSIWDEAMHQFGNSNPILTMREKEVLKLIAEGASINEAAEQLHLSSYTVRDYVSVIIQKLAAKNRTEAAVKALRMNLIS